MISIIVFAVVALAPIVIFLINAGLASRDQRGIAAGIPKPKQAKAPRVKTSRAREARVRSRRVSYCGRGFTHFALALMGSQDSCRYCAYLEEVPPPPQDLPPGSESDTEAAVRAAEEIIDKSRQ